MLQKLGSASAKYSVRKSAHHFYLHMHDVIRSLHYTTHRDWLQQWNIMLMMLQIMQVFATF